MKRWVYAILCICILVFVVLIFVKVNKHKPIEVVESNTESFEFYDPSVTVAPTREDETVSSSRQSYVFGVAGNKTAEESTIQGEDVKEDDVVLNGVSAGKCFILYEVDGVNLYKDTIRDGYAYYEWIQSDGKVVPVFLTIESEGTSRQKETYENYLNEEWRVQNGITLINECKVESYVGEGNAYLYSKDGSQDEFVSYVDLLNGYTCVLKMRGEFEFTPALNVVENILTNGVTVIMSSTCEDEGEGVNEIE